MDKDLKILVHRLERAFPEMEMSFDAHPFESDKHSCRGCIPPHTISWYEFLEKLDEIGLKIVNKKQ